MTVTYILWVVLECIIFSVMVAGSGQSMAGNMEISMYLASHMARYMEISMYRTLQ